MKIEGYRLVRYDEGYWSTHDIVADFHQDSGPMMVLERVQGSPAVWRARILNGPWCENLAFQRFGSFHYVKKHLARAIREEQHIYA
jgi:hypothetical protein